MATLDFNLGGFQACRVRRRCMRRRYVCLP
jgi:hypothetical protein